MPPDRTSDGPCGPLGRSARQRMPERAARASIYEESVFFKCPFDNEYKPIFEALIFAAFDCGYVPRCALETEDAGQVRVEKIISIIRGCRLGVHDISRTELDAVNQLPRFNMPFEFGVFVGAARFGGREQRLKVCLVLDRERYRFQKFISDVAGQDIREHGDDPERAIAQAEKLVRDPAAERCPSRRCSDRRAIPGFPRRTPGHPFGDGRPPQRDGLCRLRQHRLDLALRASPLGKVGPDFGKKAGGACLILAAGLNEIAPFRRRLASMPRNLPGETP